MFVLYVIRSTLSAIRDKCIILHHKSQFFKHFGVLMTNKHLFRRLLKKANNHSSLILNHLYGLHSFAFYILIFNFSPCLRVFVAKNPYNQRNLRLTNDLRAYKALYNCREDSTTIESSLQIKLFMQNKANFRKSQMNVNNVLTRDYEKKDTWWSGKNKPNSNPIQTQFKANTNPIKANTNPKQTQSNPNLSAISVAGRSAHLHRKLLSAWTANW